jgi:hypothetical protein
MNVTIEGLEFLTRFIALSDIARYTHILVSTVTYSLPLLGSGLHDLGTDRTGNTILLLE